MICRIRLEITEFREAFVGTQELDAHITMENKIPKVNDPPQSLF